jgi:hypothetical protein
MSELENAFSGKTLELDTRIESDRVEYLALAIVLSAEHIADAIKALRVSVRSTYPGPR